MQRLKEFIISKASAVSVEGSPSSISKMMSYRNLDLQKGIKGNECNKYMDKYKDFYSYYLNIL